MEILNTMKQFFTLVFSIITLFGASQPSELRINEVMSSNGNTVLSGYGLYSDWIELYNTGSQIVDIGGMYISDDPLNLMKYRFPAGQALEIVPGGFFLIWADDSANAEHTNFKLSSVGEKILLVDTNGTGIIDSVSFPALQADQSYGRSTDGTGIFQIFVSGSSTPSASNNILSSRVHRAGAGLGFFPNPVSEVFFLHGIPEFDPIKRIEIIGNSGEIIKSMLINPLAQEGIHVNDLPGGVYYLRMIGPDFSKVIPMIKL